MAIQLKSTKGFAGSGVKLLVYGQAGAGKTSLIPTLPDPIILSAEGGLLSISGSDIPYIEINSASTFNEALEFCKSAEASQFQSVALDSISEIAEVILSAEKAAAKDPRQAYGQMQDIMGYFIREFRDLSGKHVYFSAKMEKSQDELGRTLFASSMPGNKLAQSLPYFFDEVLALRVERDSEGNPFRTLMTRPDGVYDAKDRSGRLDMWEEPDLGAIIKKIGGE